MLMSPVWKGFPRKPLIIFAIIYMMEHVQRRIMKLEGSGAQALEWLRDLEVFSLKKSRLRGDLISLCN